MTFAGAPLPLLGGALAGGTIALVALYVLKLRRRRVEVPFAGLWRRVLRDTESTALWRRLRRLLSLLLAWCVFALVLSALADPRRQAGHAGRTLVLLVDLSASMQAVDGAAGRGRSRFIAAQEAARRLVRSLGGEDSAMLLQLDARPSFATGLESDERELLQQIDALEPTDAPADLAQALRLAGDALRGLPNPTIVLFSDGAGDQAALDHVRTTAVAAGAPADPLDQIDLTGVDLRFVPTGGSSDNVGITSFAVRRYRGNATSYEVRVEVQSFRETRSALRLELLLDGETVEVEPIELAPGERLERVYPNLAGEGTRLEARLRPAQGDGRVDALAIDDRAFALLPPRGKQRVLLVSSGNLFLEGALLLDENLAVTKISPNAYDAADTSRYDAVVLDGYSPEDAPHVHALYLAPEGPGSPFKARGRAPVPAVTEVLAKHPLMRWVALKDLNISSAARLQLEPGDVAVASAPGQPLIVARDRGGKKTVAIAFDLRQSDLPMRVAFPVLLVNALDWFAGADTGVVASYPTGRPISLPAPAGATVLEVTPPHGEPMALPVREGRAAALLLESGFYVVRAATGRPFAVNLANPSESAIAPPARLLQGGRVLLPPTVAPFRLRRDLWPYLALAALLLLVVEWFTYNRRVTV